MVNALLSLSPSPEINEYLYCSGQLSIPPSVLVLVPSVATTESGSIFSSNEAADKVISYGIAFSHASPSGGHSYARYSKYVWYSYLLINPSSLPLLA